MLQDEHIEISLNIQDYFLWMGDLHLYFFCKREQGLFHEMVEEEHLLENSLIGLFEIISPESSG